jgi:hypothetical protein
MKRKRHRPVAVLGSGPAGLLAAHAATLAGKEVEVWSLGEPSKLVGPQYLYQFIPKVTPEEPEGYVRQIVRGTMTDYRRKLYGEIDPGWIERPMQPGYDAWNLRTAYERLWEGYGGSVLRCELNAVALNEMIGARMYSHIISTIPAPVICRANHQFLSWRILIADRNVEPIPDNTILFNGEPSPSWIRESRIWGVETTEWPYSILDPRRRRTRPPLPDVYEFEKPLRTNCDCFPEVARMGRFGRWRNETWAHDAYNATKELLG